MVDEAKLRSRMRSIFEALVVGRKVRRCRGEELGPFCRPRPAAGIVVFMHLINLLSILLRCNGFAGTQKAVVNQTGSRPPPSDRDFAPLALRLWSSSSKSIAST